jgi:D-beta-D-heptose 7-phosphate kinase/D-beta-D-heptose 1-phosphate adenosyltransferase
MTKIKNFEELCQLVKNLQKENKKIVFVHGIFDILHKGHITLLLEAKKLGDVLIVGVDHDDNAKILKGPTRPINNHDSRIFVLSNLEAVNYVFLIPSFKDTDPEVMFLELYKDLNPDIVATSIKAGRHGQIKKDSAKKIGAKFVDINHGIYDKGTTKTMEILGLE